MCMKSSRTNYWCQKCCHNLLTCHSKNGGTTSVQHHSLRNSNAFLSFGGINCRAAVLDNMMQLDSSLKKYIWKTQQKCYSRPCWKQFHNYPCVSQWASCLWNRKEIIPALDEVCGLFWVPVSWFLERHSAAHFFKQVKSHLVPLYERESSSTANIAEPLHSSLERMNGTGIFLWTVTLNCSNHHKAYTCTPRVLLFKFCWKRDRQLLCRRKLHETFVPDASHYDRKCNTFHLSHQSLDAV